MNKGLALLCFALISQLFDRVQCTFSDIMNAINSDNNDRLKMILDNNKQYIDLPDAGAGQTPLMFATLSGKYEIAKTLLDAGASTSIGEENGYTPIHGAGFQGRADIVELLVSRGVDPNDRHIDGFTPYHRACWGKETRHSDTVKAFLKAGVDINLKSSDGKTCLAMTSNKTTKKYLKTFNKTSSSTPPRTSDSSEL